MEQQNSAGSNSNEGETEQVVDFVFDRYVGKSVAIQMSGVLYTVTYPGTFSPVVENGELAGFHKMPILAGILKEVVKDKRGNARVIVETHDILQGGDHRILVDLDISEIGAISLVEE